MREELLTEGYEINVVVINRTGKEGTQQNLVSRCDFDLLQDVVEVGAWTLMDGVKDDIFIYREGGTLAPGGYLATSGPVSTMLSSAEGY